MRPLPFRMGASDHRARFTESETQLAKQVLALSHPQADAEALFDPRAERLAIPEVAA